MTTAEFIDHAIKALAAMPTNAARRAALTAKIEACHRAYEAAMRRIAQGGEPPKTDFFTIQERIGALESLLAKYERAAA